MIKQNEKYRQFKKWQHQPHEVAPLAEEMHECATCGTHFEGNYCPRCGQSAQIGRYSFKKAFLLFLDVWGVGNRGMFRSIRDLLLRPGYMIRDYLRGMQMAYFPPFKMLFLLCAFSILVESGLNIQGINHYKQQQEDFSLTVEVDESKEKTDKTLTIKQQNFSVPLDLLIRHSPAIPDFCFSECFVAMIYITNMLLIYGIFFTFLWPSETADNIFDLLILPLSIIPIKQFSGYSYWSTIWRTITALIPFVAILLFLIVASFFIYGYIYINY